MKREPLQNVIDRVWAMAAGLTLPAERTFGAAELKRRAPSLCVLCWHRRPTRPTRYKNEPNCLVTVQSRANRWDAHNFPFSLLCATCGAGLGDVHKNSVRRFERLLKGEANGKRQSDPGDHPPA